MLIKLMTVICPVAAGEQDGCITKSYGVAVQGFA